jgi:molybdopterin synthase catalytic subunit
MIKIRVLFFATLRERAGVKEIALELAPDTTVADLKAVILEHLPGLQGSISSTLTSVNKEYAFDETIIPDRAEVAFFPPVSGGAGDLPTIYAITELEIDLDTLLAQITLPSTGAAAIFTGMVRGFTSRGDAHETVYLEYEAYKPMAEAKMKQVAEEIRQRWPTVEGIAVIQRIGHLFPGTPTVLIACTAPHRDTGVFEAARYGIDRLKEIVPVWKKEVGPDGSMWLEGEYTPKPGE